MAFAFATAAHPQLSTEQVDTTVQRAMQQWGQIGLAVAIVDGDGPDFVRGYGVRDVRSGAPVTPDTIFGIGSLSKAFAAADVAKLVDGGRVGWEDRVVSHLPWFRTNDPWVTHDLTVRDILTHRTGLQADIPREAALDRMSYLRSIATTEPRHRLRSQFSYTNEMFTLAGELVAEVSGQSWEDFTRENFWAPLGMSRTNADHRVARRDADSAAPHVTIDRRPVTAPWIYEDFTALPSGGVNSTAADLAKWLRFQMSDGTVGGRTLLSRAAMNEMHTPQTPLRGDTTDEHLLYSAIVGRGQDGIRFENYAMGWFAHDYRGHTVIYHGGSISGFRCVIGMLPEENFGVAILINQDNSALPQSIFQRLVDLRLGIESQDWPEVIRRRFEQWRMQQRADLAKLDAARVPNTSPSRPLQAYAGSYTDVDGEGAVEIRLSEGRLLLTLGRAEYEAAHWHYDVFRLIPRTLRLDDRVIRWPYPTEDMRAFAIFQIDPRGEVSGLESDFGRFERLPSSAPRERR